MSAVARIHHFVSQAEHNHKVEEANIKRALEQEEFVARAQANIVVSPFL